MLRVRLRCRAETWALTKRCKGLSFASAVFHYKVLHGADNRLQGPSWSSCEASTLHQAGAPHGFTSQTQLVCMHTVGASRITNVMVADS